MDRLLKPQVLSVDPGDPLAIKAYKHWIKTFNAFAEAAQKSLQTASQSENTPNGEIDKLALLTCYLSPEIYELIEGCETYKSVKVVLNRNFLKRKSTTYARHLLLTREQKLNETIGDYARALRLVAKDCEWRAVNAQEFQTELTRDTFITGLSSPMIKQRLLEKDSLTLEEAICKAEVLERAQNQSSCLSLKLPTSSILFKGYKANVKVLKRIKDVATFALANYMQKVGMAVQQKTLIVVTVEKRDTFLRFASQ